MAAANAVVSTLRPGDLVVAGRGLYGGVASLLRQQGQQLGLSVNWVDSADPSSLAAALQPNTSLVWLEVASNPTLDILDLRQAVELVRAAAPAATILVDNTFLTPWVLRPLQLGVDIVLHSVTKYISGHSDVIMGALLGEICEYPGAGSSPLKQKIQNASLPFNAF